MSSQEAKGCGGSGTIQTPIPWGGSPEYEPYTMPCPGCVDCQKARCGTCGSDDPRS
jgi:hypothetical protein